MSSATSNVIALWQSQETMTNPIVSELINYWDHLRAGRDVPLRAEIEPKDIQSTLSNSFILERSAPGTVRFRLAGVHMNELMGMEVRGMPVRAFFELSDRKRLMEHVEMVFEGPCILDIELISDSQGSASLEGRMVLMPLRNHDGEISRALGVLVTDGLVGLPPRRFRIRRQSLIPVQPGKPLMIDAALTEHRGPGLSEDPRPYNLPNRDVVSARHQLRVIKGGKVIH